MGRPSALLFPGGSVWLQYLQQKTNALKPTLRLLPKPWLSALYLWVILESAELNTEQFSKTKQ